jgi:hypothetical protein
MLIDLLFGCATAFGESDDGGIYLDNDLPDNRDDLEDPGSMDDISPPVAVAYPQLHPPFDMWQTSCINPQAMTCTKYLLWMMVPFHAMFLVCVLA